MKGFDDILLPDGRTVPPEALRLATSRSGGAGGQHVNKTSTRVQLFIQLERAGLEPEGLALVRERLGNRINALGELVVDASSERSQYQNRRQAYLRAGQLLADALAVDPERHPTAPSAAAKDRRVDEKKRRGQLKAQRRLRGDDG